MEDSIIVTSILGSACIFFVLGFLVGLIASDLDETVDSKPKDK